MGKKRTMWRLVANRYTIFSKQIKPSDDDLVAYDIPNMSSQWYASEPIAYDLANLFTLIKAPWSVCQFTLCFIYKCILNGVVKAQGYSTSQ